MSSVGEDMARLAGEIDAIFEKSFEQFAGSLEGRGYRPDEVEQALNVAREMHAAERIELLKKAVRFALQPDAPSLALN